MTSHLGQVWPRLLHGTLGRLGGLRYLNLTVPVFTLRGTVRVPFIAGRAAGLAGEPWMNDILAELLPAAPGVFVDVGVNLGQTLIKVKLLDRARPMVGFEPNPVCVAYVRKLLEANRFPHVEIVPAGLAEQDGILSLDLFSANDVDSAASVVPNFRPGERVSDRLNVPAVTWATARRALGPARLGIVKVDVEGAELEVFRTMASVLESDRPTLLFEVLPVYRPDNTARAERQTALEGLLHNLGYRLFRVEKTRAERLESLREIDSIGVHGDLTCCDYVALTASHVDRLAPFLPLATLPPPRPRGET